MDKKKYNYGKRMGELIFLYETPPKIGKRGEEHRMAKFACFCGGEIITHIASVKAGLTRSCGCLISGHGMSGHKFFVHWSSAKTRCYNPNHSDHKWYGGRGIQMWELWKDDPKAYLDYIASLPNAGKIGCTIDRKNNNGNYEPGNLRWATQSMQVNNSSSPKSKTGYVGVYKKKKRYVARVYHNGKRIKVPKTYPTPTLAVVARNEYVLKHQLDLEIQEIKS